MPNNYCYFDDFRQPETVVEWASLPTKSLDCALCKSYDLLVGKDAHPTAFFSYSKSVIASNVLVAVLKNNRHCEPLGVAISLFILPVNGVSFSVAGRLPRYALRLRSQWQYFFRLSEKSQMRHCETWTHFKSWQSPNHEERQYKSFQAVWKAFTSFFQKFAQNCDFKAIVFSPYV